MTVTIYLVMDDGGHAENPKMGSKMRRRSFVVSETSKFSDTLEISELGAVICFGIAQLLVVKALADCFQFPS